MIAKYLKLYCITVSYEVAVKIESRLKHGEQPLLPSSCSRKIITNYIIFTSRLHLYDWNLIFAK